MKKQKVYIWYSLENDYIFEIAEETSVYLMSMMCRHVCKFNQTMMFLGEL